MFTYRGFININLSEDCINEYRPMNYKVLYYMSVGRRDNQEDCIFVNGNVFQEENIDRFSRGNHKGR